MLSAARALALVIASVACGPLGLVQASASPSPRPDPRLALVASLSGSARSQGVQQVDGVTLAVEQANAAGGVGGRTLGLVVEDDRSTPDGGVAAFRKVIEQDRALAVLGPTLAAAAVTSHPIGQALGVPVIAVSNPDAGVVGRCAYGPCDWIFRASLSRGRAVAETVRVATQRLGLRRVAVISGDGKDPDDLQAFREALRANNVAVSREIPLAASDAAYAAAVALAKADGADAVVVGAGDAPALRIVDEVARQMRGTRVLVAGGRDVDGLLASPNAGVIVLGTAWSAAAADSANADFVAAFRARYGKDPDQFAAQAYSGALVALDALRRATDQGDRKAVRAALETVRALPTPTGLLTVSADHEANPSVQVVTGRGKAWVPF